VTKLVFHSTIAMMHAPINIRWLFVLVSRRLNANRITQFTLTNCRTQTHTPSTWLVIWRRNRSSRILRAKSFRPRATIKGQKCVMFSTVV